MLNFVIVPHPVKPDFNRFGLTQRSFERPQRLGSR
jgi:hypothetical protein